MLAPRQQPRFKDLDGNAALAGRPNGVRCFSLGHGIRQRLRRRDLRKCSVAWTINPKFSARWQSVSEESGNPGSLDHTSPSGAKLPMLYRPREARKGSLMGSSGVEKPLEVTNYGLD
jgi:hypothetical protein